MRRPRSRSLAAGPALLLGLAWSVQPTESLFLATTRDGGDSFSTLVLGPASQLTATGQPAGVVSLTWTAPAAASIRTIGYTVQRTPHGGAGWTTVGTTTGTASYRDTPASDGPYDYRVVSTAGSFTGSPTAATAAVSDRVPPAVTLTCNAGPCAGGWYRTAPVTAVLTAADTGSGVASITATLDGTTTTSAGATRSSSLQDGVHTLSYSAADVNGNSSATGAQSVRVDSVPPVISSWAICAADGVVLPALPNWVRPRGAVQVFANVSDATSGVATVSAAIGSAGGSTLLTTTLTAAVGSCAGTSYGFTSPVLTAPSSLTPGAQSVYVDLTATDVAGNSAESNPGDGATVGVDGRGPTLSHVKVSQGAAGSGRITLSWTSTAGISGLAGHQLRVCLAGTGCTAPAQYPSPLVISGHSCVLTLTPGVAYDIYLTASDNAGGNSLTEENGGEVAP